MTTNKGYPYPLPYETVWLALKPLIEHLSFATTIMAVAIVTTTIMTVAIVTTTIMTAAIVTTTIMTVAIVTTTIMTAAIVTATIMTAAIVTTSKGRYCKMASESITVSHHNRS